jgi:hypothetical protein
MFKRKRTKGQTMIYRTLQRHLNCEQHEPHKKPGMNLYVPEGLSVPAALVVPVNPYDELLVCLYDLIAFNLIERSGTL